MQIMASETPSLSDLQLSLLKDAREHGSTLANAQGQHSARLMWAIKGLLRSGLIEHGTGRITDQGLSELQRVAAFQHHDEAPEVELHG